MSTMPNRSPEPDLLAVLGSEPSSSSAHVSSSVAVRRENPGVPTSRHVLPKNLNAAIRSLDDQELKRLLLAALEERARRKLPVVQKGERKRAEPAANALPKGKLNAIHAAFKAGVAPSQIARQFGISRSDVQTALAGYAKTKR
jgi:hypothetical protein